MNSFALIEKYCITISPNGIVYLNDTTRQNSTDMEFSYYTLTNKLQQHDMNN
jgi:hypothetical protein